MRKKTQILRKKIFYEKKGDSYDKMPFFNYLVSCYAM